jgi:hypothetical protein
MAFKKDLDSWTSIRTCLNRETDKDIIDFYYKTIQPSGRSLFIKRMPDCQMQ